MNNDYKCKKNVLKRNIRDAMFITDDSNVTSEADN